jgi:hypothetical protein
MFGEEYKLWSASLCSFLQYPVTSYHFGPIILLRTFFLITLSLWPSLKAREQVSHRNKTTGKITVIYILVFMFLDSRREDKMFWSEW